MKPIIYRFCLLICILSLTISCKQEGEKKFVVGVSHSSINDSWRKAMVLDMQVKASEYPGLTLQIKDAGEDNDTQIKQIREFIKQRVDLVIISANESEPVTTAAVEAFRAGIPTIIIDRKIYSEEYTTFIGADNYEIGRAAGLFINSLLKKEKTTIVEVWGREGSSSARDRHNGFSDALIHNDNVILKTVYGRWHSKETKENIAALGLFDDIDIVYAHNDVMALAAREAIMEIDPLAVKRIKFIGIDALPGKGKGKGIEAVSNGYLTASFVYPTGGTTAIKVAWQILNGQPVSKQYALTSALIDKENAGTLYLQTEQLADYQEQIEKQRNNLEEMLSEYRFLQNSVGLILLLLGVVGLLALYVIHIFRKVQRKNHELKRTNIQVEQQREELAVANRKIEQATTRKLQFFTNVSHEIKTPLTLILGPLNKLSKELPPDSPLADDIHIIKKNADRLKRVVSQLLDFRKVESNKMDMRVTEIDLITFIEDVSSYFDNMAQSKQIQYSFQHDVSSVMLWVDTDKMEKILANLLSNAFKFTPDGGTVTIRLQDHAGYVILSVVDNGKGIQPQNLSSVFDQFFTADHLTGTGIGLHLTHEFVGMHKGSIRVESEPGKRTVFFVELPKGKSHFDESCVFAPSVTELSSGVANLDTREMDEIVNRTYDYTILIVEDDPDINAYLQKELKPNFRILAAENGRVAVDILAKENVSLVISDVMMPEMNGYELCKQIKSDIVFSHIPVILLTALSDDKQRMYGIASGADEFIQKPFNIEEVKLRIVRLLEERARLRNAFAQELQSPAASGLKTDKAESMDELFMRKFMALIEESYPDSNFSIEKASEMLGLSRVHLYRKVKELTGVTPTDFLRNYRLKQAAALLRQKDCNVNEAAYATGFSSPPYFSKCFKAVYNITPTEYQEKG